VVFVTLFGRVAIDLISGSQTCIAISAARLNEEGEERKGRP
jgi:hypothetical protein